MKINLWARIVYIFIIPQMFIYACFSVSFTWPEGEIDQSTHTGSPSPSANILWCRLITSLIKWTMIPTSSVAPRIRIIFFPSFPKLPGRWRVLSHPFTGDLCMCLGLANEILVIMMRGSRSLKCAGRVWLVFLCSWNPLWEGLTPDSYCPFSLSLSWTTVKQTWTQLKLQSSLA